MPTPLGGVTIKADDPDTLLVGGAANSGSGAIYAVPLERDPLTDEIIGFAGPGTLYAQAPNIDGGLTYAPGTQTLFYTAYPTNQIGQILPGQIVPSQTDTVTSAGIPGSVGSLVFTPSFIGGSGALRVLSFGAGGFYTLPYAPDGDGTFTLGATAAPGPAIPPGAEGAAYVPMGSAGFAAPSILIANYSTGTVMAYEVDSEGLPVLSTERTFVSDLVGAVGSHIDVLSGDFLFTTFYGSNNVTVVRGFESTEIAPVITTSSLPAGAVGAPYSATVAVTGEPLPATGVSSGDLPPGLSFDPIDRKISGSPTDAGEFEFTLTATNTAGADTRTFTIVVEPAPIPPAITTMSLPGGVVGAAYSATVAATGVPAPTFTIETGALPTGVALNPTTGAITGTPSEAGTFSFEVAASSSAGRSSQAYSVDITAAPTPNPSPTDAAAPSRLPATGADA